VFGVGYAALVERAFTRFRSLRPRLCSIYDPYFWWHERLWKLGAPAPFNGTPFKNVIWRLLGVRIGHRVFDDGCAVPEKTLVTIGDDATLNAGSVIQCHSLEEGIFKSDRTTLGAGCTLGVESFVHYGVTMGEGATLDADSFLMKGEQVPSKARWRGNPAGHTRTAARDLTTPATAVPALAEGAPAASRARWPGAGNGREQRKKARPGL
jgi:non-ribosomal peptide synthetase-like protein